MSFLLAISVISIFVMFPVLLSLRTTAVPGITQFCAASVLAALSIGMMMTAGFASAVVYAVLGNLTMIAACLMILSGFRHFLGRRPLDTWTLVAMLASAAVALILFTFAIDGSAARVALASGTAGLIFVLVGVSIVRHWPRERAIAPYMLFCCIAAFTIAALHLARCVAATSGMDSLADTAQPQMWVVALATARMLFMPVFLLGVILMIHGQMIAGLRHIIARDDLTGALSRRAFLAGAEAAFDRARLADEPMAFLLLDLDRFKQINDLHGHAGGDIALTHFTETVGTTLAGRGTIGRLGGEEFGIALIGVSRVQAAAVANAICAAVRNAPASSGRLTAIDITVSIGLAMAEPGDSLADMMVRADMALYEAKAAGRDCARIAADFHTMPDASARALAGAAAQMKAGADLPLDIATPARSRRS